MDNAQLVSLSRQIALQRQMTIVANNMANINTTGFKAESILFAATQMPNARDMSFSAYDDQPLEFTEDWASIHDLAGGAITQTGNPLDVALEGEGFLTVQMPDGQERYTRNGSLHLDAAGTLVDANGNPVLTEQGAVRFGATDTDIQISGDGTILTETGAKGRLRLVDFDNPQALARVGDNLFSGSDPRPATGVSVVQGAIERSNVSGVSEMTEMIRVSRAYQSLAGLMQQQDETRRAAIQRLGSLSA